MYLVSIRILLSENQFYTIVLLINVAHCLVHIIIINYKVKTYLFMNS